MIDIECKFITASDLALKARSSCLGHNPALRECYQDPGGREQERGIPETGSQLSKESSIGETARMIDQNPATCQPTHEQLLEPGYSLGISR